jgi:hypothetical protein
VADVALVLEAGASAASLASVLHYNVVKRMQSNPAEFASEINLAHLNNPGFGRIKDAGIDDIKNYLATRGFHSRPMLARV